MSKRDQIKSLLTSRTSELPSENPAKKSLLESNSLNTKTEETNVSVLRNTETEAKNTNVKRNAKTEQLNEIEKHKHQTESENVSVNSNTETETLNIIDNSNTVQSETPQKPFSIADHIAGMLEIQEKDKRTVEDTHKRATFLIRNDLLQRLDKVAKRQSKGYKTRVINQLLQTWLDSLDAR
ncbi:hypothetical protein [Alicyclobacillus fodiniaquatilis]|uniref:Uncharacterized protein n=1 Tax=Alicyclobacillus fodiniaquatilis TaxID=1661150 RepID=A0ABW4JPV1_9BACL